MPQSIVEDMEQFKAYLAAQPLCQWAAQKEREIASGAHGDGSKKSGKSQQKSDNADLAAALSSMA